jgi:hypothetical protein
MISIPQNQWAEQQQRLVTLEASLRLQKETIDRLSSLVAPTPSATPHPVIPEPIPKSAYLPRSAKVAPPDQFSGDRHKIYLYLSKCRHNFLSQPELFTTEAKKVLFASGYLDGAAYNWFQPLLDRYASAVTDGRPEDIPAQFQSFGEYTRSLEDTFGDPDLVRSMERELRNLSQTTSVASYTADFNRIKGFVKWNDDALTSQFYKGLKSAVKDGLVYENPAPITLPDLVSASLRIDSRQFERYLECKSEQPSSVLRTTKQSPEASFTRSHNPVPRFYANAIPSAPTPRVLPTSGSDGSTPMELDFTQPFHPRPRGPLTETEKQRRRDLNLCNYCASPSHHIQACPICPPRSQPPRPQQVHVAQVIDLPDGSTKDLAQE